MAGGSDSEEPTLEEKLASLNSWDDDTLQVAPLAPKLPSADSVHLLIKQALHADDHALLLDSLYTRDEKVRPVNSVMSSWITHLSQAVIKGAVLACAIPWLKALLNQHASSIASQESSLHILNSIFQLVEARISNYKSAFDLSTCLDYLYAGIPDDDADDESIVPVIYEDQDSEDAMDTDDGIEEVGVIIDSIHSDGSEAGLVIDKGLLES